MHNGHQNRDKVYLNLDGKLNRQGSYHQYKQEYLGKIAKNQPTPHSNIRQQPQIQLKSRQMQNRVRISRNSENEYSRTVLYDQSNKAIDANKQSKRPYNEEVHSPQRNKYNKGNRCSNQNIANFQSNYFYGRLQHRQDKQETKHNHYRKYEENIGKMASIRQLDRSKRLVNRDYQNNERFYEINEVSHKDHFSIPDKYQTQSQSHIQKNCDDSQRIAYSHHNTPIRTQKNSKLSYTPDSVAKSKQRRQNLINRSIQLKQRMNQLSGRSMSKKGHQEITNSEFDGKYSSEQSQIRETNSRENIQLDSQRRLERLRGQPQERLIDSPYRQQQSGLKNYKRYSRAILEDSQHEGTDKYQNQVKKIDLFTKEIVKHSTQNKSQQYHQRYPLREQKRVQKRQQKRQKRQQRRQQKRQIGREDKKQPEWEGRKYGHKEESDRSVRQEKVHLQQGDCMSRITMLNKKINERINSIINNFGSPS